MDGARGPGLHTETMEPAVFEYPPCPLRDASHAVAAAFPPVRVVAALAWPAARRAERVEVSADGIVARSLAGHHSIAWGDIAAVRRARTTWGRMTVHIIARTGSQIEIAETIPGFDELAAMLRQPLLRLAA
jgi:PH (Pleckstrin Homology) domain-containing protein